MLKKLLLLIALCAPLPLEALSVYLNREIQRLVILIIADKTLTEKHGMDADHLDRIHMILDLYVALREYRGDIKDKYPYIAGHIDELERIYEILGNRV